MHGFRKKEITIGAELGYQSLGRGSCFFPAYLADSGVKFARMSWQSSVSAKGVWCSQDPTTPRVQSHTILLHPCPRLTIKESLSGWLPTEP